MQQTSEVLTDYYFGIVLFSGGEWIPEYEIEYKFLRTYHWKNIVINDIEKKISWACDTLLQQFHRIRHGINNNNNIVHHFQYHSKRRMERKVTWRVSRRVRAKRHIDLNWTCPVIGKLEIILRFPFLSSFRLSRYNEFFPCQCLFLCSRSKMALQGLEIDEIWWSSIECIYVRSRLTVY